MTRYTFKFIQTQVQSLTTGPPILLSFQNFFVHFARRQAAL